MEKLPVSDNRTDILLKRYEQHAEHLRALDLFDLRVTSGFLTLQILLAGWLYAHPAQPLSSKMAIILIDLVLFLGCIGGLRGSSARRREIRGTIWNVNEALGLYSAGMDLPNRPLDHKRRRPKVRWSRWPSLQRLRQSLRRRKSLRWLWMQWLRWLRWYDLLAFVSFVGLVIVVYLAGPPLAPCL
jgi:hypothetical protein